MKPLFTLLLTLILNNSFCQDSYLDSIISGKRPLQNAKDFNTWMNYIDTSTINVEGKKDIIIRRLLFDLAELNQYSSRVAMCGNMTRQDRVIRDSLRRAEVAINEGSLDQIPPIYILDGIPMLQSSYFYLVYLLSKAKVYTVSVLPLQTAVSLYGSQATGGIVLLTTKKQSKKHQYK